MLARHRAVPSRGASGAHRGALQAAALNEVGAPTGYRDVNDPDPVLAALPLGLLSLRACGRERGKLAVGAASSTPGRLSLCCAEARTHRSERRA